MVFQQDSSGQGLLFILSGPAGCGKTTVAKALVSTRPQVQRCITCTTRQPRQGEVDGRDYRFLSLDSFAELEEQGAFLESAWVHGHRYGTLWEDVERMRHQGVHVLLVIDVQGMKQVVTRTNARTLFLLPPSMAALEARLQRRGTESAEERRRRLGVATEELRDARLYHYVLCNDTVEESVAVLDAILVAEAHTAPVMQPKLTSLLKEIEQRNASHS